MFKALAFVVAPVITSLQIAQMGWFLVVTGFAYYYKYHAHDGRTCDVTDHTIYVMQSVILSYFILFGLFFITKYMSSAGANDDDGNNSNEKLKTKRE
eukprot:CAMPEP_0170185614 /NCGR_PEP_ID=MMETSP0040_2-20121228/37022_1 /TAXON_ID=641309 /ORGANISM="Lotharella oceanica, Strain CCMP622" /LENGTH=96 /DNA_ID=CAMNT_0010432075 /DNA_START=72 /DNA_END=362 /DNA_ORIENTATION=-